MKLAVNYSPQAARLLHNGAVEVDLYKTSDAAHELDAAHRQRPAHVHLSLRAGRGGMDHVNWAAIDDVLHWTGTPYINLYIAPYAPDFPGMPLDSDDSCWTEQVIARVLDDVARVSAYFGAENVVLENAPWDARPGYLVPRPAIDPAVIAMIVREAGTGFVLDTAHARIAALHLDMDPFAYLDALPVERLRELHMSGVIYDERIDAWRDHFAMTDDDWSLACYSLSHIKRGTWPEPVVVALEYGGVSPTLRWRSHPEVLARELPRLRDLMGEPSFSEGDSLLAV